MVLASITIITLDYRGDAHGLIDGLRRGAQDVFSPVRSAVDAVVRPAGSFLAGAVNAGSIEHQNAELRAENARLRGESLAAQSAKGPLASLRQLENLPWAAAVPQLQSVRTVAAEVVALNSSNFADTVQLDVGRDEGVDVGMPVVGGNGLVGRVIDAWSTGSTVRLLTDPASAVGIRFGQPPGDALLQGTGAGRGLVVHYVAPGTALHRGELLTTSGLQNALFPPGVPVASVVSYSSTPSSTEEQVSARPVVDLAGLQYVDVMLWEPQS